ncbi:hypothetical protein [Chamaesiphon sp. GL140_3_metabinner_50]|nr:hypothetical protein [Chamaesiphon sp. GL140_3_metabinner_50]
MTYKFDDTCYDDFPQRLTPTIDLIKKMLPSGKQTLSLSLSSPDR